MDNQFEFLDRSDHIRDVLDDELSYNSDHASDINSDVGEQFDEEVFDSVVLDETESDEQIDEVSRVLNEFQVDEEENDAQAEVHEEGEEDQAAVGLNADNNDDQGDGWREWKENDVSLQKYVYVNQSGFKPPRGSMPESELEYFQLFFTDSLLQEIVNETNRYTKEKIQMNTPLLKKSIWWSWKDLTLPEIKAFLGILINMGMHPKPEVEDYFSNDYTDYQPFFKDTFTKDRFHQIFWNLHVSPPPSGPVGGYVTRSGKVRRVVSYLDKKYRQYYVPQHKVSVDESTVAFKGRVCFKMYNKDKPIKWGIRIWVLSESDTGYICALEPYLGKATTNSMTRQDLGVTSRVVLHLVEKLENDYGTVEGLHVFTDRLYTNLDLASALHEKKVHITGTIVRNRKGLPPQVRASKKVKRSNTRLTNRATNPIKLKRGEIKAFRKDDKYSLLIWKDTNDVTMLTTLYDASTQEVRRIKKGGSVEIVQKPTVVCKYNESMGGVDLMDHYISSYPFIRKSIKWWRKIFFWLVETAIVNAFILYNSNKTPRQKVSQRKFRKQLVKQLVGEVRNVNKRRRPNDLVDEQRLDGKLHLMYPLEGKKAKDCTVCSDRSAGGVRKRTIFICKTCLPNPGLCPGLCFEKYHTQQNFKN